MKTQDKIDAIKDIAINHYNQKATHDEICGLCLPHAMKAGIGFGEISALVKNIGENEGFITKIADRKTNAATDVGTYWNTLLREDRESYDHVTKGVAHIAKGNNVPVSYVRNLLQGHFSLSSATYPVKSEILDWQKALVDCFIENPKMTKVDVHDCVIAHKKETSVPKSMLPMLQYLHRSLTA